MNIRPLKAFLLKSGTASHLAAGCLAFLSISAQTGIARADTGSGQSSADQNPPAIEIHGQKGDVGPQCLYLNLATVPVRYSNGFMTIKGNLNGKATMMIIDTGTLHSLLTEQETETLGLTLNHSKITGTDANGDISATYATFIDDISFDRFFWHRVTLGVVPSIPQSYSALAGADILLNGLYKDVEISLATKELKIFVPSGCEDKFLAYWDEKASTVPLVDVSPQDSRQVVTVKVNGHDMTAMIDSGAPTSMIDLKAAAIAGVTPESAGVVETNSGEYGKQHGKAWLASFESFSIGGETIKNPKIRIADLWGPQPAEANSELQAGLRMQGLAIIAMPATKGNPIAVTPASDGVGRTGSFHSEAAPTWKADMLLGADFLRTHRVLLAMSQRRLYYSYLGGRVFGNDGDGKVGEGVQTGMDGIEKHARLNP